MQIGSKFLILLNYELNKEYIVKALCENRNKPKIHCNGHCHIAKQFKKEEKKEQNPISSTKEKFELAIVSERLNLDFILLTDKRSIIPYLFKKYISPNFPIFHPPASTGLS